MPRRAAKVDQNQAEIVAALRAVGAGIQHLHMIGQGCPDLLVGVMDRETGERRNYLFEIKDGTKKPSAQSLTPDEERWEENWPGQYQVVRTVDEALRAIGVVEVKV